MAGKLPDHEHNSARMRAEPSQPAGLCGQPKMPRTIRNPTTFDKEDILTE